MKSLADEVLHTVVIVLVAAVLLHWAWTTVRPLLWFVLFLVVVVSLLRYQRR